MSEQGYTRHERTRPVPDLPSLKDGKLRSGLDYSFDDNFVPQDLWQACGSGRWVYVIEAMEKDPNIINTADEGGATMLHWACLHGANVMVSRLLDMGHALNVLNSLGQTPFMWAAIQGRLETLDILRTANVDLEVHDDNGATALLLAVQHKRPLAMLGLLSMGANIDAVDNQGCGIAHYAASVGNMDVLRILKSRGYALTKLDNRGMQPLHRCARSDQGDVVSFLVQEGNDPFLKAEGKTPRDMAREFKHHYAAGKLLKAERAVKSSSGSLLQQIIGNVRAAKERERWMWCAGWAINYMGSLVAYWSGLLPVAAMYPNANVVFILCMVSLGIMYPILTFGDPGRVSEATPKYPGHKPGTGHSEPERHDHDGVDEESGLLNGGGSHTSFVSRLTTGIEALTRDQRAAYVCFSCDLVKPLRSKHCSMCDVCVDRMDHHCVWINNCVGQNNQRMFNFFCLAKLTAVTIFVFFGFQALGVIWTHSVSVMHFVRSVMFLYKMVMLHMAINMVGILATGQIVYSQFLVMAKNMTTNEQLNMMRYEHFWREFQASDGRRGRRFVNPFSQDRLSNVLEFWGLREPKTVTMHDIVKIVQDNAALRERDFELFGVVPGSGHAPDTATGAGAGAGAGGASVGGGHGHSHGDGEDHGHSHSHSHGGHGGHGHSH